MQNMTWQTAKNAAIQITGRTPRWCDVRNSDDQLPPAPTAEAMDDCIALDAAGEKTFVTAWQNEVPCGKDVEAVCYF